MITRLNTKFGMAMIQKMTEGYKVVFDKPASVNGRLKTSLWWMTKEKLETIKL